MFPGSVYCALHLLDSFFFAHGYIRIYAFCIISIFICLILQLPFVWGSPLVSPFWIFILMLLNVITNHFWNLHSWPDQALSLCSGRTDSKTLDYQRANPREYQTVRTPTNKTTWIQEPLSPNHQKHTVQTVSSSKQQTKRKYRHSHQQTGLPAHSALPIRGETIKNQSKSHPMWSLHQPLDPP